MAHLQPPAAVPSCRAWPGSGGGLGSSSPQALGQSLQLLSWREGQGQAGLGSPGSAANWVTSGWLTPQNPGSDVEHTGTLAAPTSWCGGCGPALAPSCWHFSVFQEEPASSDFKLTSKAKLRSWPVVAFLKHFLEPRKAAAVAVLPLPAGSQALTWAEAPQLPEWVPSRSTVGCPETGRAVAKKPRGPRSPIGSLCFSSVHTCGTVAGPWQLPGQMMLLWAAVWSSVTIPLQAMVLQAGVGTGPFGSHPPLTSSLTFLLLFARALGMLFFSLVYCFIVVKVT